MADRQRLHVKSVGVIGAGVSGISSAVHLKKAGLDVTVFERSDHVGGVWSVAHILAGYQNRADVLRYFDEHVSKDAAYPSLRPSVGDSPEYEADHLNRKDSKHDSPVDESGSSWERASIDFAPPGPCYNGLRNNVSTHEMELQTHEFDAGTEEFVNQQSLSKYLRDAVVANNAFESIKLNTRVESVQKVDGKWQLETTLLTKTPLGPQYTQQTYTFDAVIVANGNYHAPNIPDIPGLSEWKQKFPDRVKHSKLYRRPDGFEGENVLLIGGGTSSTDIARELAGVSKATFQSVRGGLFDLPNSLLPDNAARIGGIRSFNLDERAEVNIDAKSAIPGSIALTDGTKLCEIHRVIVATGYHVSLPFLRDFHRDDLTSAEADESVLITDGQQTHNLHNDIFYINDPTLAFIGVPYHTATWSFFEFQAVAVAQVLLGNVSLPSQSAMRQKYNERLQRKGAGRSFHSLKGNEQEVDYVKDLVQWVNSELDQLPADVPKLQMRGHSEKWFESYGRRAARFAALFGSTRDPAIDQRVLTGVPPCS